MDRYVVNDPHAGAYIARLAQMQFDPAVDQVLHREDQHGILYGGVIYSFFTGESLVMSTAGPRSNWLSRRLLWMSFHYPFEQLGCNRVFSHIREDNLLSLGLNSKLGFKPVAFVPGVYRGGIGMVVTCLERTACRWLELGTRYRKETLNG